MTLLYLRNATGVLLTVYALMGDSRTATEEPETAI